MVNGHLEFMDKYLVNMENISCPLCEASNYTTVGSKGRGNIRVTTVLCNRCGHLFLNPRPVPSAYYDFFSSGDYRRFLNLVKGGQFNKKYSPASYFIKKAEEGQRLYHKYFKGRLAPDDIVFDFGCGNGGWLAGIRKCSGCRIDGNEPCLEDVNYIKKELNINIFKGPLEEISQVIVEKHKNKVSLAIISSSLPHMLSPMKCLEVARTILKDNGCLYICDHDILERMKRKHDSINDVVTIDHLHYFYKYSYSYMVRRSGFSILDIDSIGAVNIGNMGILAQKTSEEEAKDADIGYSSEEVLKRITMLNKNRVEYRKSVEYKIHSFQIKAKNIFRRLKNMFV